MLGPPGLAMWHNHCIVLLCIELPSWGLGCPQFSLDMAQLCHQNLQAVSKVMQPKEGNVADAGMAVESNSGGEKSNIESYKIPKENCSGEMIGQQHRAAELVLPHLPEACWLNKRLRSCQSGGHTNA